MRRFSSGTNHSKSNPFVSASGRAGTADGRWRNEANFPGAAPARRRDFAGAELILSVEKDHGAKPVERRQPFQPHRSMLSRRAKCKWLIPLAEWLVIGDSRTLDGDGC